MWNNPSTTGVIVCRKLSVCGLSLARWDKVNLRTSIIQGPSKLLYQRQKLWMKTNWLRTSGALPNRLTVVHRRKRRLLYWLQRFRVHWLESICPGLNRNEWNQRCIKTKQGSRIGFGYQTIRYYLYLVIQLLNSNPHYYTNVSYVTDTSRCRWNIYCTNVSYNIAKFRSCFQNIK